MLARHRRGAPKRRHSIGSTLDGVSMVLRATGSCVPDHSERVVGDGEDECGIRASGATTISKHQDTESDGEVYTDDNDEGQSEYSGKHLLWAARQKFSRSRADSGLAAESLSRTNPLTQVRLAISNFS